MNNKTLLKYLLNMDYAVRMSSIQLKGLLFGTITNGEGANSGFESMRHSRRKFFNHYVDEIVRRELGLPVDCWEAFADYAEGPGWHTHFLMQMGCDVHSGFDFDAYKRGKVYNGQGWHGAARNQQKLSLAHSTRSLRQMVGSLKDFRDRQIDGQVGRVEIRPVDYPMGASPQVVIRGLLRYMVKYASKTARERPQGVPRGARLVQASMDFPGCVKGQFSTGGPVSALFRSQLRIVAKDLLGYDEDFIFGSYAYNAGTEEITRVVPNFTERVRSRRAFYHLGRIVRRYVGEGLSPEERELAIACNFYDDGAFLERLKLCAGLPIVRLYESGEIDKLEVERAVEAMTVREDEVWFAFPGGRFPEVMGEDIKYLRKLGPHSPAPSAFHSFALEEGLEEERAQVREVRQRNQRNECTV